MTVVRALCLILCVLPGIAGAQSDAARLAAEARVELDAAHTALQAAEGARNRVAALTQTVQAYERGLIAMREGLRLATIRESALRQDFEAESEQLSELIGILLGIRSVSGPLTLLHPAGPLGTARSGMIVSDLMPEIQSRTEDLRGRVEEVAVLRALQQTATDTLQEALDGVQDARTQLSTAVSNRTDLPQRFTADPERLQLLINSAETLDGFASGLADLGPSISSGIDQPKFEDARGSLPLPVNGALLRGFGQADAAGVERPGLLVATRPLAVVTAPWASTIRFRGPLLDYGLVTIVEPQAGWLLVLAGMNEAFGEIGEVVPAGTALGLMGGAQPDANAILLETVNSSGSDLSETIYIELRHGDDPVDPGAWFANIKD